MLFALLIPRKKFRNLANISNNHFWFVVKLSAILLLLTIITSLFTSKHDRILSPSLHLSLTFDLAIFLGKQFESEGTVLTGAIYL